MKAQYSQAFLEVVKDGMSVEAALAGLRLALEKKNHTKLLAPVLLVSLLLLPLDWQIFLLQGGVYSLLEVWAAIV